MLGLLIIIVLKEETKGEKLNSGISLSPPPIPSLLFSDGGEMG